MEREHLIYIVLAFALGALAQIGFDFVILEIENTIRIDRLWICHNEEIYPCPHI